MDTIMHHDDTPDLDLQLAQLRTGMAGIDTPRCVEKELMQAFAAQFAQRRPWYRRLGLLEWGAAGIGGLVTVVVVGLLLMSPHLSNRLHENNALVRIDNGAAFIALDSFERIEAEPAPRLVETEVPRTMLAALGLPVTPENAGDAVRAEMLVGAGGEPLALRLSSLSSIN
jgi:hypothetical protein